MSQFRSMTITVGRNVTETGGDFHEITVNDIHQYGLDGVMRVFESAGYDIVSVLIDGYDFSAEMVNHIGGYSNLILMFDTLCTDEFEADTICAFITVNDCADVDDWHESVYISGASHEDVVREWAEIFHKVYQDNNSNSNMYEEDYVRVDPFPYWMDVNWEETLDKIARENSSSVVEFNDMIYYFG